MSNSALSSIKDHILGLPGFTGEESYLAVGREIHRAILEPHKTPVDYPFTPEHLATIRGVVKSAIDSHQLQSMLRGGEHEQWFNMLYRGVYIRGVIDSQKGRKGLDLKTTSCATQKAFIRSAVNYSYFRQGALYMRAKNLEEFWIVGLQKKPPHKIFYLNVATYPHYLQEGLHEANFLIDYYKKYGL